MQNHKHTGANQHTNKLWVSEEIKEEKKKNLETNENEHTDPNFVDHNKSSSKRDIYIRLLWETRTISDKHLTTPKWTAATAAKSLQSCPTLHDPIDGSPPGSPIPGILQARALERVAISFSNAWKWKVKVKLLSPVWLLATLWTAAYQASPSMGFSRQEYWSGVPLPSLSKWTRKWKINKTQS